MGLSFAGVRSFPIQPSPLIAVQIHLLLAADAAVSVLAIACSNPGVG